MTAYLLSAFTDCHAGRGPIRQAVDSATSILDPQRRWVIWRSPDSLGTNEVVPIGPISSHGKQECYRPTECGIRPSLELDPVRLGSPGSAGLPSRRSCA